MQFRSDRKINSLSKVNKNDEMWLDFNNNYKVQIFCIDYYCDKRVEGETDNFLRVEKDNEIILRFDGMTGNLEKSATSKFIASIYFDNTDCGNNTINSYYFFKF